MIKTIRNLFICVFCFFTLVSTGFGLWYFNPGNGQGALQGSSVSVESDASPEIGEVRFASPIEYGYAGFLIYVFSDFKNMSNLCSGVSFAPNIRFYFSNFDLIDSSKTVYYYFTFESSSPFFATNELGNGYVLYDTSQPGHAEQNKIQLNIRDGENQLIQKKDELGEPILDQYSNPIYEVSEVFMPVFKYINGAKPSDIDEYKTLLDLLNQSEGESVLKLHIILQ